MIFTCFRAMQEGKLHQASKGRICLHMPNCQGLMPISYQADSVLQISTFTLLLADITDCVGVAFTLEVFIPGSFVTEAHGENIPLQSASLTAYACSYPGMRIVFKSSQHL